MYWKVGLGQNCGNQVGLVRALTGSGQNSVDKGLGSVSAIVVEGLG